MAGSAESHNTIILNNKTEEDDFSNAWHLVLSSVVSLSLKSALELGVFEILAKAGQDGKLSADEIVAQIPDCNNPDASVMLDRILRLLASHKVLGCSLVGIERFYSLTSVAKFFVLNQDGVSLGPLVNLILDQVFLENWPHLKDAVLEGGVPFDRAHGVNAFEYPGKDPRFNEVFNKAMFSHTTIVIKKILECYKGFEKVNQLVDVGGGLGVTIQGITSKYPHIKGINFDLPHVVQHAHPHPGVEHVGGDMFVSVPKGDVIFMKWILHDWSDEHCLKLLKNCYNSIPDDGKVIVVDSVVPVMPETSVAVKTTAEVDVLMMTHNPGGKERTKDEFIELATEAGFSGVRFECYVCNFWVMEFFK